MLFLCKLYVVYIVHYISDLLVTLSNSVVFLLYSKHFPLIVDKMQDKFEKTILCNL